MDTMTKVHPPKSPPGWVNRMMGSLLRSPLAGLFSKSLALLTVFGSRTGRPYTFPVQYLRDGEELWILSGAGPDKTWWRNLRGGAPVQLLLGRRPVRGRGIAFRHDDQPEVVEEGLRRYLERFPGIAKRMGITPGSREDLMAAAAWSVIVRIRLEE